MVLRGAVTRVRDLVGLDGEPECVAEEEDEHDGDEDERGLFAPLAEVLRALLPDRRARARRVRMRVELAGQLGARRHGLTLHARRGQEGAVLALRDGGDGTLAKRKRML